MVEGPMACVKYCVFAFNLMFLLAGLGILGLGIYVQVTLKDYLDFFSTSVNGPAILLIVVGIIIAVIAFFGCCGAIKENHCMIMTFCIILALVLVCELAAGIAGFVLKGKVESFVKTEMIESMTNYGADSAKGVTLTWDMVQKKFNCCGVVDYHNWITQKPTVYNDSNLPASCCLAQSDHPHNCTASTASQQGCSQMVINLIEDNVYYIGAVGVALAIVEITGIVLACCLARAVKKQYEVV